MAEDRFITLSCQNCGGRLEVYDDMERFACGYCGTEMIVQRRGGTVALRAVAEAIRKVQIGTDRTASELAVVRLEKELKEATEQRTQLATRVGARGDSKMGCGIIVCIFGIILFAGALIAPNAGSFALALCAAVLGVALIAIGNDASKATPKEQAKLNELDKELTRIKRQLEENRQLLRSA